MNPAPPAYRYVVADVFTDTPLEGNAVAVFTEAGGLDAGTMARLARELNLSETVFVLEPRHGGDAWIRIFTPRAELPFAGHPVLGSAFVLAGEREVVRLETGRGIVPVALERDGDQAADAARAEDRDLHEPAGSSTPGFITPAGSRAVLAAVRAARNSGGICFS